MQMEVYQWHISDFHSVRTCIYIKYSIHIVLPLFLQGNIDVWVWNEGDKVIPGLHASIFCRGVFPKVEFSQNLLPRAAHGKKDFLQSTLLGRFLDFDSKFS